MRFALVALALFFAACSDGETDIDSTLPETTTAPQEQTAPLAAECVDPADDAGGTSADLTKVSLVRSGDTLTATYDLAADVVEVEGGASWLTIASIGEDDDYEQYQLGLKVVGDEVFRFVYQANAGPQVNLDTPYTASGRQVVASFPLDEIPPAPFAWRAATTSGGNDADACPDTGTLTFGGLEDATKPPPR